VTLSPPQPFDPNRHSGPFESGNDALDRYFDRIAKWAETAGDARTYVVPIVGGGVAGYYTLSAAAVDFQDAPDRLKKGAARRPVPAVLLGRLAVNQDFQGMGVGAGMLTDAIERVLLAARSVGVRVLLVHAKNAEARNWYLARAEFLPSPFDSKTLMLPLQDIDDALESIGRRQPVGTEIKAHVSWAGDAPTAESLWFSANDDGTFTVANIPAFIDDLALGDVVRMTGSAGSRLPMVTEIVRRGGHSTVGILFSDQLSDAEIRQQTRAWSEDLAAKIEGWRPGFVGVSVPWDNLHALESRLVELSDDGIVEEFGITCGVDGAVGPMPWFESDQDDQRSEP
jgi:GNAT superfamily N-acetyltransferase